MPRGYFITFEGLDGSGKTTQLLHLADFLKSSGYSVVTTRQPGGTLLGTQLRNLLVSSDPHTSVGPIAPLAELALMFADRAQAIAEVIAPALAGGSIVLCDRFTDSSEAYQGAGRKLGTDLVLTLHRRLCRDLQPDLTILLLPPLAIALQRARGRNRRHREQLGTDESRFEAEADPFYERIHAAYVAIAERDPTRVVTIDADASIDDIKMQIATIVAARLRAYVERE